MVCYHVRMPRKPKPPPDDPEQSKRFIEAARAAETDESPEAFERVFDFIVQTGSEAKSRAQRALPKAHTAKRILPRRPSAGAKMTK
jgi:hypothetical protein